jgi:PAS domain S-box-containing protein
LVASATLLRWALPDVLAGTPYLAFYPAVVLAAGYAGAGPGLVATLGSLLCVDLVFDTTPGHLDLADPVAMSRAMIFLAGGAGISVVAGMQRSARARERKQATELAEMVQLLDLANVLVRDLNDRIVRWNTGCQRLYGFPAEQALGRVSHELLGTRFPAPLETIRATLLDTGRWEGELVHTTANGRQLVVASEWILFRDPRGAATHILEMDTDITQRKLAEEKLRESEQRFRSFVEATTQIVWTTNSQGEVEMAIPAWQDYTGQTAEEARGFGWMNAIREADRPRVAEAWRKAVQTRGLYEVEYLVRARDGSWQNVLARGVPVRNPDGTIREYLGVCIDVTARKRAEQALQESELFYRQALESIPGMVFTTRPDGYCDYQSQQWVDYTGVPMSEHLGDGWNRLLHPADRPRAFAAWQAAVEGRAPYDLEYRVRRHDGQYEWFKIIARPIRDSTGQIVRWFGVALNIEDLKRVEDELKAAKESAERAKSLAEQANRAKDHFLAVLSHELRTPLTPVVMGLSLVHERPDLDPEMRETLEMVRRNVEMEARLIDDLLDVTRIARGKVELARSPVELCTVIRRAVEVCQPDIDGRKLHFGVDLGPSAPYWVAADVPRLQQVFWNLLKNAIKFTPQGGCVGIRCYRRNEHVFVEVNDSGIGIEPQSLPRIFNAFEQVERSITQQFGGLGLGLAISKALVELHDGEISAHSEGRDKGATFLVQLPLCIAAGGAPAPAATTSPPKAARALRILLVEDHGVTAKMMRMVLTAEGHTVEAAADVTAAVQLATEHDFELLISDLGLPDGSGHDLLRELRRCGKTFPAIALSGYGQEEDIRRSSEAGFATHLTKPASREQLLAAVAGATAEMRDSCRARSGKRGDNAPTVAAPPVFNVDEAIHHCADDREMFEAMVGYFFDEADPALEQLRTALAAGDAATVGRVAHRFKGTLGYLGARPATQAVQLIEQAGQSGDLSSTAPLLDDLARQLELLKGELARWKR